MDGIGEKDPGLAASSTETFEQLDRARRDRKEQEVRRACEQGNVDELVQLADSTGGLLDDTLRQLAWPILLGCSRGGSSSKSPERLLQSGPAHQDEEQVQRDVDRSFVFYANNAPEAVMETRKKALFNLIVGTLRCHPMLCYFQGYHDIIQVLMLVLGPDNAYPAIESLSLCRIRDYMLPSLTPALKHLRLLPAILKRADSELAAHLSMPHPNYALPAALTLYAHEIQEYSDIARLFDFLLAHEPVISIYLFAAIIVSRRDQLLEIPSEEQDMLFFTLQKLPQPLDLEPLIQAALRLFAQHSPERLPGRVWHNLSCHSVLKTSRSIKTTPDLAAAEQFFQRQAQEMRWEERRQKALVTAFKYRRPLASTLLAVVMGAMSIWLRKSGNDRALISFVLSGMAILRGR